MVEDTSRLPWRVETSASLCDARTEAGLPKRGLPRWAVSSLREHLPTGIGRGKEQLPPAFALPWSPPLHVSR